MSGVLPLCIGAGYRHPLYSHSALSNPRGSGGRDEQGFRIAGLLSSAERIEFGLIIRVVDRARRGGSIGGDERWREREGAGSEEPDHLEAPREGLGRELVRLVARGAEELGVLLLGPRWVEDLVGARQRLGQRALDRVAVGGILPHRVEQEPHAERDVPVLVAGD